MADAKQVKIAFAVDAKGLQDARRAIRDLTSDVQKLVETMGRAGAGMGSLLGGVSGKSGPINTRQEAIKLPGVGSSLAGSITKDAQALGQVARAGSSAMDQLTRSLKSNFSSQIQDIERLKKELGELEAAYNNTASIGRIKRSPAAGRDRQMDAKEAELQRRLDAHGYEVTARKWASGEKDGDYHNPWSQKGGKGWGGSFGEPGGKDVGKGFVGGALNAVGLGGVGALLGVAGPAALAASVVSVVKTTADATASKMTSNASDRLNRPMEPGRLGARIGNSMGAMGMSIRGGDLALSMAYDQTRSQMALRGGFGSERERIYQEEAGYTGVSGFLGGAGEKLARIGTPVEGALFSKKGLHDNDKDSRLLSKWKLQRAQQADITEEQVEIAQNYVAAHQKQSMFERQTYGDAFGNISMARTGAIGLGLNKNKTNTNLGEFNAKALAAGYSPGEWASARASLGGIAGRGLMGHGPTMLSAQLGGFQSAGQVMGAGAQFGPAMGLFNTAQLGQGRGGLDVTAGSQIAAMVAQNMTGGNFAGSTGQDALAGLMSAARLGGGTTGGDMRMARVMQAGMGEYGRNLGGKTDKLQEGINMLAANASGASGWYAKKALMDMDPTQMLGAMRSGKLPDYLKDQGLTIPMVEKYNSFRNQHSFSRYMDSEGAGTNVGASVAGAKRAGGVGKYLHSLVDDIRDPGKRKEIIKQELDRLTSARQSTEGGSREGNMGALYAEISTDKSLTPDLKGKGGWAVGIKNTTEGEVAKNQAKAAEEYSKWQAAEYENLKAGIGKMDANQNELAQITKGLVGDSKNLEIMMAAVTDGFGHMLVKLFPAYAEQLVKDDKSFAKVLREKAEPKDSPSRGGDGSTPAGLVRIPKVKR